MLHIDANEQQTFLIPETFTRMPLTDCLRRLGVSTTLRRRVKHHGSVIINGVPSPWAVQVDPGSTIQIAWKIESSIEPENIPLSIAYEDEWLLIIDKPAGMLVHPTTAQMTGTLANAVIHYYRSNNCPSGFHPVQRLDRNTSGLLLVAKFSSIHHQLNAAKLRRVYTAIAKGTFTPPAGTIDLPIARDPNSIILRQVNPAGQTAVTHYKVIQSFADASLLQLELTTGRTHQIRVHLSHIGHPLLGDDLYGGCIDMIPRQALHSSLIEVVHPVHHTLLQFVSPLPSDMTNVLTRLNAR